MSGKDADLPPKPARRPPILFQELLLSFLALVGSLCDSRNAENCLNSAARSASSAFAGWQAAPNACIHFGYSASSSVLSKYACLAAVSRKNAIFFFVSSFVAGRH